MILSYGPGNVVTSPRVADVDAGSANTETNDILKGSSSRCEFKIISPTHDDVSGRASLSDSDCVGVGALFLRE